MEFIRNDFEKWAKKNTNIRNFDRNTWTLNGNIGYRSPILNTAWNAYIAAVANYCKIVTLTEKDTRVGNPSVIIVDVSSDDAGGLSVSHSGSGDPRGFSFGKCFGSGGGGGLK